MCLSRPSLHLRPGQKGKLLLTREILLLQLLSHLVPSGYRGAAARADQLLDKMEAKYVAGDMDLKPNTFTYNAVSFLRHTLSAFHNRAYSNVYFS
jgi:hypothetical protein